VDALSSKAAMKGLTIQVASVENVPAIYGDSDYLRDVFYRLIDNAIKFSQVKAGMDAVVLVTTTEEDGVVKVCIEDHGVGIPERHQARLFELFFQHNREMLEQQGAGLGLTIAKGLVELHGGRVEVESDVGVGSKFTVVLPIYTARPAARENADQTTKRATVLVVEDDLHLLQGLEELLEISTESYHYHPLAASNGERGLELLAKHQPDLIISDIMMPKMGGFEFLQRVRSNPDWVEIPFIFLTAKGERHEIHSGLRSGVEEYITKPYDSDELLELVAAQLDRHFQVQKVVAKDFEVLKRGILSLITPDFRLPLSSVTKYSEMLAHSLDHAENESELKSSLHGIRRSSIHLTQLVEDFISLAELKTGEALTAHDLNARVIADFNAILAQAAQPRKDTDDYRDLKVHLDIEPNLPAIFADAPAIVDMIRRLIEAGVSELGADPAREVFLSASKSDDQVELVVRFPKLPGRPTLRRLTRLLNQDDSNANDETHHLVPNLSIAKGVAELHDGRVEIGADESEGCSIVVCLPAYEPNSNNLKNE
jgi:signal transduction histidine kinase